MEWLVDNWESVLLITAAIAILLAPVIPPTWVGMTATYIDPEGNQQKSQRFSLWGAFMKLILQDLIVFIGFRGTITLVLLGAVGLDIYFQEKLTTQAVVLAVVGLVALYFEQLMERGEYLELRGIFRWKKQANTPTPKRPRDTAEG
ncbi:MAG: hypothetical protein Q8Q11_03210 [bacterium]|nr:hypothetical protein [bacterium]